MMRQSYDAHRISKAILLNNYFLSVMKSQHLFLTLLLGLNIAVSGAYAQTKEKENIDVLALLKTSGPYDRTQKQDYPEFTYQSPSDPNLTNLRKTFNLDSVAGKGTDVQRAIRLLEWMHNTVPHDDVRNLKVLNAMNIINTYKQTKYAQGCYGLSISMNEVFLAMGFKSRSVICFSSLPVSRGGHVINAVYLNSLKKWVWMDPQENAYVMDEKGNLLGLTEVRQRLIDGRPLVLSKNANYHQVPTKIQDYLYTFMAEHLYRMICPLSSEYNSQTREKGKLMSYVELLPANSAKPGLDMFESQDTDKEKVVNYHTSNDLLFWKKP